MTATLEENKVTQSTISSEFRMKWCNQIMKDHGLPLMEADRIISNTLSFLTVCAVNSCSQYRPSKKVDIGWHQFILNTRDYAEFCQRVVHPPRSGRVHRTAPRTCLDPGGACPYGRSDHQGWIAVP